MWIRRARQDGERSARRQGKPRGSCLDLHEAFIVAMIGEAKDITLNEMASKLCAERGLQVGRSALSAWLGGRGWTWGCQDIRVWPVMMGKKETSPPPWPDGKR